MTTLTTDKTEVDTVFSHYGLNCPDSRGDRDKPVPAPEDDGFEKQVELWCKCGECAERDPEESEYFEAKYVLDATVRYVLRRDDTDEFFVGDGSWKSDVQNANTYDEYQTARTVAERFVNNGHVPSGVAVRATKVYELAE